MFYNKQKNYIIDYLKSLLEKPDEDYKGYSCLDIIKYGMYYLGYIPDGIKKEIINKKLDSDMKLKYESYV